MKQAPRALLMMIIAGLSLDAHALCVKQDGSLDDASMSAATVAVDMLPACETAEQGALPEAAAAKSESTRTDIHAQAINANMN